MPVVGGADGGAGAPVGAVGEGEDLAGAAALDDAVGAGRGQVVDAARQGQGFGQIWLPKRQWSISGWAYSLNDPVDRRREGSGLVEVVSEMFASDAVAYFAELGPKTRYNFDLQQMLAACCYAVDYGDIFNSEVLGHLVSSAWIETGSDEKNLAEIARLGQATLERFNALEELWIEFNATWERVGPKTLLGISTQDPDHVAFTEAREALASLSKTTPRALLAHFDAKYAHM